MNKVRYPHEQVLKWYIHRKKVTAFVLRSTSKISSSRNVILTLHNLEPFLISPHLQHRFVLVYRWGDYLSITNEDNQDFSKYCGGVSSGKIVKVTGRYVSISFHSNGWINWKGYNLSFSAVPLGKYCEHVILFSNSSPSKWYTEFCACSK